MGWFFNKSTKAGEIEGIQEVHQVVKRLEEKVESTDEQLKKLMRLQFKMAKQLEENASLIELKENQQITMEKQVKEMTSEKEQLVVQLIRMLDEMDTILDGMDQQGQDAWTRLMEEWSKSILRGLEEVGVMELKVLGTPFDPAMAEGIQTIDQSAVPNAKPYEIVRIVKRGFVDRERKLIRKAQVVTNKGE